MLLGHSHPLIERRKMSVYRVIMIEVRDVDGYEAFAKVASAALARYGGETVAKSADDTPHRVVVQRFPDGASVRGHYCDPELQEALATHQGSFTRDVLVIDRSG